MSKPYTPETLAERWDCSPQRVRRLCREGTLSCFKLGKLYRIPVSVVEGYECGSNGIEGLGTRSGAKADRPSAEASEPRTGAKRSGYSVTSSDGLVVRL